MVLKLCPKIKAKPLPILAKWDMAHTFARPGHQDSRKLLPEYHNVLWIKTFHIVFVVSWFAGLLYLPRLYVYHADISDEAGHARFLVMERKLFAIMTIAAVLATVFGLWLLILLPVYLTQGWLHVKLALYVGLVGYHLYCWTLYGDFQRRANRRSHRWFRWFNEIPAIVLILMVAMVVVRPF